MLLHKKHLKETIPYDKEKQIAIVKSSICTGEKVAGFKDIETGHFTEVMLIRKPDDLEFFKKEYGIEDIKTEY